MCNDPNDPRNKYVMRCSHSNLHGNPEVHISCPEVIRMAIVGCSTLSQQPVPLIVDETFDITHAYLTTTCFECKSLLVRSKYLYRF